MNGTLDEAAIFNRSLSSTEILDHYKRGIVRLNVSVRSCDDSLCSGETFTDITDTSPQNLSLTNNQYFQYNVSLEMDNASYSSEVYNVTVFYSPTDITAPTVTLNTPADNFFNDTASPASVLFNCSATDNSALANISLYITNLTNQSFALNQTANISGTSNSTVWTLSLGNGNYTWNCLAYDSSGNSDWGDANRSMLVNFTAPLPIINYNLTFVMNETTTVAYGYLNGTLNAIFYNNSINALHLNATFNNGTFTSQIFDAGSNKVWNNISWVSNAIGELPSGQAVETKFASGQANMTGNVLLLHLDETTMDSAPGGTDVEDFSGRNNHGNEFGSPIFGQPGKFGNGLLFNNTVNDITVLYNNDFNFSKSNAFTVGAWVKSVDLTGSKHIITHFLAADNNRIWGLQLFGANARVVGSSDGFTEVTVTGNTSLQTNMWYFVAGRWNGTDLQIFVNGIDDQQNTTSLTALYSSSSADIKLASVNGSTRFNGTIDEVALWNRSLSNLEILNLYKRGAMRLNFTVRSCNNSICNGETFTDINDSIPQSLSVTNNQYFQYNISFETDNASYSPELYNVTISSTIDTTPPTIIIVSPTNTTYANATQRVNISAIDTVGVNTIWYDGNGTNVTYISPISIVFNEGGNILYAYANDTSGNLNSTRVIFSVDTITPLIQFTAPTTIIGNFSQSWIVANVTAADVNLNTLLLSLYNSTGLVNSTSSSTSPLFINFSSLSEGTYYLNATANDTAGNINTTETRIIIVDTIKPTIHFTYPTSSNNSAFSRTWLAANVTTSDTNFHLIVINLYNTTNLVNSTGGITPFFLNFTSLPNGTYYINATANDTANNLNSTETRMFILDTTSPSINFTYPTTINGSIISQNWILANLTASDPYLSTLIITLYNSTGIYNFTSSSSSPFLLNFTNLANDTYYLNATANDTLGNINNTKTRMIIVDTTSPSINFTSPTTANNSKLTQNWIDVNITSSDTYLTNISLLLYNASQLINSTSSAASPLFINLTNLPNGRYYFNATASDTAGNFNQTETRTVTLDTGIPFITYTAPTSNNDSTLSQSWIAVNVTTIESNLEMMIINIYNSTLHLINVTVGLSSPLFLNLTSLADGVYYYNATANDTAGNINKTETRTIRLDTQRPLLQFAAPTTTTGNFSQSWIAANVTAADGNLNTLMLSLYNSTGLVNSTSSLTSPLFINFSSLSDGTYYLNATVNDTAGNINTTETRMIILDSTVPTITLISPVNNTGDNDGNVTFSYTVTDVSNVVNCSLAINSILNQTNSLITKNITQNFTLVAAVGSYNWSVNCTDAINNIGGSERRVVAVATTIEFSGETTDLSMVNVSNITNLVIDQPNYGMINFSEGVDLSLGGDVASHVNISFNRIEVNSTALPALNKLARLRLYNLTFSNPRVLKESVVCSDCTEVSYSSGVFVFDVVSFSVYSTEETPSVGGGSSSGGGGGGGVSYLPPVTCVPQCALNEIQCITVSSYLECQNNKSQCLVWVQKSTLSGKQCLQNQLVEVIIKKTVSRCREQWNCTEWSPCLEGQRERVCEDTARCGTAENKPAEQKSCFKLGMAQALMREAIAPLEGCTLNWLWNVLLVLILMGILLLVYKLISTMRWSRLILIFFSLVMVLMEYSFIRWDSCGGKIRVAAGMGILLVLLAFYVLKKKNIPQGKANGREYLSLQQFEKKMMKKELRRR